VNPTQYPSWCLFTSKPCLYDLTRDFMYPSYSIVQENIISDCTKDWFSLEVLTPMGDVNLDIGIWKSSFPLWALARVAGPRRSSNEAQHRQSWSTIRFYKMLCVTHALKKKWHEWPRISPPLNSPDILRSMHLSLFLCPLLHKSQDKICFKGGGL
jgi:hypothetical protein